jgi:hypothetical protein
MASASTSQPFENDGFEAIYYRFYPSNRDSKYPRPEPDEIEMAEAMLQQLDEEEALKKPPPVRRIILS